MIWTSLYACEIHIYNKECSWSPSLFTKFCWYCRILNSANVDRAYDGLLWTLRYATVNWHKGSFYSILLSLVQFRFFLETYTLDTGHPFNILNLCLFNCIQRSLQELSSALLLPNSMTKISSMPPSTLNEVLLFLTCFCSHFWCMPHLFFWMLTYNSQGNGGPTMTCEIAFGQFLLNKCGFSLPKLCFLLFIFC